MTQEESEKSVSGWRQRSMWFVRRPVAVELPRVQTGESAGRRRTHPAYDNVSSLTVFGTVKRCRVPTGVRYRIGASRRPFHPRAESTVPLSSYYRSTWLLSYHLTEEYSYTQSSCSFPSLLRPWPTRSHPPPCRRKRRP
jgi:hypothetical protein